MEQLELFRPVGSGYLLMLSRTEKTALREILNPEEYLWFRVAYEKLHRRIMLAYAEARQHRRPYSLISSRETFWND